MGLLKVLPLFICVGGGEGVWEFICNIMIVLFVKDILHKHG